MSRPGRKRSAAPLPAALTLIVCLCLGATACGSDDATSAESSTTQRLATCEGLADRWVEIQQSFLDDLGDASAIDGTASPQVLEAGRRMGLLLLEHGRDLERAGCDLELAPGSPQLCARLDQLSPAGPAGREVVDGLGSDCP